MKNVKPGHSCPVICLDAGHYADYNRCPAIPEYYESRMNWKLHLLLKKELESYGMKVITTRPDPEKDLGLQARGRMGKDCDLVLSEHSNAVPKSNTDERGMNESVDYVVAYVPIDGSVNNLGQALAEAVAEQMETTQKPRAVSRKSDNGDWDYYSVIYGAVSVGTPGIILEHSFHTCSRSVRWLLQDSNLEKLAKAEAKVLAEYFGMAAPSIEPAEPEQLYRIRKSWDDVESQLGAYKDLELAKQNCPEGYAVFDQEGNAVYRNSSADGMPFTDVPETAYYADAVRWAYSRGITLGRDDTHFDPDTPITRAEAVAMLHRALDE